MLRAELSAHTNPPANFHHQDLASQTNPFNAKRNFSNTAKMPGGVSVRDVDVSVLNPPESRAGSGGGT